MNNFDMNNPLTWGDEPDSTSTNDDGQKFFGFDDREDGTTAWYTTDGTLDCILPTSK